MVLVQCFPKAMVIVGFVLAIALLVITGIVFLVANNSSLQTARGWVIALGILCFILALVLVAYLVRHRKSLKYCGVFLQNASYLLVENPLTFLYIPLFMVCTFLFGILIVFQYLAFASSTSPFLAASQMYPRLSRTFWYMAPLVIETVWGLSYIRDACTLPNIPSQLLRFRLCHRLVLWQEDQSVWTPKSPLLQTLWQCGRRLLLQRFPLPPQSVRRPLLQQPEPGLLQLSRSAPRRRLCLSLLDRQHLLPLSPPSPVPV